jgi:hypothetical protein
MNAAAALAAVLLLQLEAASGVQSLVAATST